MRRTHIFTPSIIAEIVRRANNGTGAQEIARDLGLNINSLRVKASNLGISLRRRHAAHEKQVQTPDGFPLRVVISRLALARLRQWGAAKGMSAESLAAELLAVIASDGLCDAILDDDVHESVPAPASLRPSRRYGTSRDGFRG